MGMSENNSPIDLDDADIRILTLLQADGKASIQEIAEKVGLSSSPVWRRIRRLEESGAIDHYAAILDRKALGLNAMAYVFVSLVDHSEKTITAFGKLVAAESRVVECASITGESDYLLKVAARNPEDLEQFLMKGILAAGLVRATQTNFVLRRTKSGPDLPLGQFPIS